MADENDHKAVPSLRRCCRCHAGIRCENAYRLKGDVFCEDCCLELRTTRPRKTHWQYITSIKTDYLREPEP